MVRIELLTDKVRRLRELVATLKRCLPADPNILSVDTDLRDLVAFRVYLGLQEVLDASSHVIADQGWGPAPSMREQLLILARRGVLEASLAAALADGVKVRNLIGHAYADVDPVKLYVAAAVLPDLIERFCVAMLEFGQRAYNDCG